MNKKPLLTLAAALLLTACQAGTSPSPTATPLGATAAPSTTAVATSTPSAPPTPTTATATPAAATPTTAATPTSSASPSPAASQSAAAAFPLALVDDGGTTVDIPARPEKIVSLTPAGTETLFAIGAGDRVVGKVEDIADYPPEASDVPVLATYAGVDVEKIVGLNTDLVIAGGNGGTPQDTIDQLRTLHIPTLVVYAADVDTVLTDIELIGQATGDASAATDLTSSMRAQFDQIQAATSGVEQPRVFYETGNDPALYGVADDSFVAAMIELAGAKPITTGSSTVWEMPREKLVAADPQVILLGDAAYGVSAADVAARPGWANLTAVKSDAIYPIDDIVVTRPGPRLAQGLRDLVAAIHPEIPLPSAAPMPSAAASSGP